MQSNKAAPKSLDPRSWVHSYCYLTTNHNDPNTFKQMQLNKWAALLGERQEDILNSNISAQDQDAALGVFNQVKKMPLYSKGAVRMIMEELKKMRWS